MTTFTQQQLDEFKSTYPNNAAIQKLTLPEVQAQANGVTIDWQTLDLPALQTAAAAPLYPAPVSIRSLPAPTACQLRVGYVVFDVICLVLGAVGLRAAVRPATIEAIFRAVAPSISKIERIIATMGKAGATKTEMAYGVFQILKAIYSGGSLGAVFSAFVGSLNWWTMVLYGISGIATIIATVATDGIAFVAEVIILLTTFGFLATDVVKAVQVCGLPTTTQPANGARVNDQSSGKVYLALDSVLCWVPNPQTYNNLFANWDNITNFPNLNGLSVGTPMTDGARLVSGPAGGKIYLVNQGVKRWITSPSVFNTYNFSWSAVQGLSQAELDALPLGADIN